MKIAMWSGPRNLSTALMYSFGNRSDFAAWDEPFYASFLNRTGVDHPMKNEILQANESDPGKVAAKCKGSIPGGKEHWYMKHMSFHMCEGFPLDWAADCVNVHLIRHPSRVIASYVAKREQPTLRDIGFRQQLEIHERFPGPVIDSFDIRSKPRKALEVLCAEIGLTFDPKMLFWPKGTKPFDGTWAPHWYGAVHRSTGFAEPETDLPTLSGREADLSKKAMSYYSELKKFALVI